MIGIRAREYDELVRIATALLAGYLAAGDGSSRSDEVLIDRAFELARKLQQRATAEVNAT